jgi:hypothetical protein
MNQILKLLRQLESKTENEFDNNKMTDFSVCDG